VEALQNFGEVQLALGLDTTFDPYAGQPTKPHYGAVISLNENNIDSHALWVRQDRLYYGRSFDQAQPFSGSDYLLYRIQQSTSRTDWETTSFYKQYHRILEGASKGDSSWDVAKADLQALVDMILASPDFTRADAVRLSKTITEEVQGLKQRLK